MQVIDAVCAALRACEDDALVAMATAAGYQMPDMRIAANNEKERKQYAAVAMLYDVVRGKVAGDLRECLMSCVAAGVTEDRLRNIIARAQADGAE